MGLIQRKKKKCIDCNEMKYLFGKGLCDFCYRINNPPNIKKVSDKQKDNLKSYSVVRKEYLTENPNCEAKLKDCMNVATEIHHRKGRDGQLLTDKNFFMASCRNCHNEIEYMGEEVYELGFKIRRI